MMPIIPVNNTPSGLLYYFSWSYSKNIKPVLRSLSKRFFVLFFLIIITASLLSCSQVGRVKVTHNFANSGLKTIHTLDVYAEGNTIHALLSGVDKEPRPAILRYVQSLDAGKTWSTPIAVNKNITSVKPSKRGNDFQIAAHGDTVMAAWRTTGDDPWIGIISAAQSLDKGKTWYKIPSPVSSKYSQIDQGYFDLTADPQGTFHIIWLDDREEVGDSQGLRFASFNPNNKTWIGHSDLEASSCTCCWNNITSDTQGNIHVLYRNNDPRDMMTISSLDGGKSWKKPKEVWPFNWGFIGCPHQGGGITTTQVNNETVIHSVIWNGNEGKRGLFYHQKTLTETKVMPLINIGDDSSASGDIAAIDSDHLGIVYSTGIGENKKIMAKLSDDGGISWQKPHRLTISGVEPSHPKIIGTPEGFRFFWTEWQPDGTAIVVMSQLQY